MTRKKKKSTRRKINNKPKPRKKPSRPPRKKAVPVNIVEYTVTTEPLKDKDYLKLPLEVRERQEALHDKIHDTPQNVIPEMLALLEQYPNIPQFYNYLGAAYRSAGDEENYEATVRACYERYPDYLFGRIGYAEILLAQGEPEIIPEIFNHKFDLKLLYPHRNTFHISEVLSFNFLMGRYHQQIGQRDVAERYYDIMNQLAPDHLLTGHLRDRLYPPKMRQLLQQWLNKK